MSSTPTIGSHSSFGDYLKTLQGSDDTSTSIEAAKPVESPPQPTEPPDDFTLRPNPAQNLYYI